jgi:hypothetical protein
MFNLEQSISEWRGQMLSAGVKNPDIVDELESHLREDWARRVQSGESEEQAFAVAVQGVGQASLPKHEFAKLSGKKWAWLRKLKGIMAAAFDPVPSLNTFTPGARWTLELARQEAPRLNHCFVGTEHVLLGLLALQDGVVPNVLKKMGVDREGVRRQIENWVSTFPPSKMPGRLPYTPRVRKSLYFAAREAKVSQNAPVGAEHILLGLVLEGDGVAGRVLRDFGLSPETTREEIMREVGRNRCGTMDEQLENRLRFLRKANTEDMPHSDRGLLDHLLGTRQLLVAWEARPALCDAGLFHSVYGTEYYELKAIPLTLRNEVQQLIGDEAESLAWLFCMIRRETLYENPGREGEFRVQHRLTDEWLPLTKIQFQDLLTLTLANTLEAFPRCSRIERRHLRRYLRRYLRRFRDIAIPPAQRAFDRIDVHWWEIWK